MANRDALNQWAKTCSKGLLALCLSMIVIWGGPLLAEPQQDAPRHGLMWNRTGLPAVFPLQIKTLPGSSHYMVLIDAETKAPALAGFIEGGRFFKVLVPPGTYHLELASGSRWRDETTLFGAGTTTIARLPDPLTFAVAGFATKAGHIVDLTQADGDIVVRDSFLCQRFALTEVPRPLAGFEGRDRVPPELRPESDLVEFPFRLAPPRVPDPGDRPAIATDYAPYFSRPRYQVRRSLC